MKFLFFIFLTASSVAADTVVATRTIRPSEKIGAEDVSVQAREILGAVQSLEQVIGLEARAALYPGRPIRLQDVGPPALVERNQIVEIRFKQKGLMILAEGRALSRGALGERVRVMNSDSRKNFSARVVAKGLVEVE